MFGAESSSKVWRWLQSGTSRVVGWVREQRWDPFSVVILLAGWFAVRALLVHTFAPLNSYDEALLFTNAQMMNDGRVIYRDFYSNYAPGIFQLVRLVMALELPPIWTMRSLTVGVHVANAVLAGVLAHRISASHPSSVMLPVWRRVSWATTCCVLVLQTQLGVTAFAYSYGVLLVQLVALIWPAPGSVRWRFWVCGAVLGLLSYLRQDLIVYVTFALCLAEGGSWLLRRRSLWFASWRDLGHLAASAAGVAASLWLPVFWRAGFGLVLDDLVFDVSRVTMPARVLPIPPLFVTHGVGSLNLTLPALLAERTRLCLLLMGIAVVGSIAVSIKRLASKGELSPAQHSAVLLAVFSLATVPQALGRTDYWHAAFGLPLVFAAGASVWIKAVRFLVLLALLPWFSQSPGFIGGKALAVWLEGRPDEAFMTDSDRAAMDYLRSHTQPGDAVYVGCTSHSRLVYSPISPYYFAHRPGATRFMQLDPGLMTEVEGQREMVADLSRVRPKVVLRFPRCFWDEPNQSQKFGAVLLDQYLARHYAHTGVAGEYQVWTRLPEVSSASSARQ